MLSLIFSRHTEGSKTFVLVTSSEIAYALKFYECITSDYDEIDHYEYETGNALELYKETLDHEKIYHFSFEKTPRDHADNSFDCYLEHSTYNAILCFLTIDTEDKLLEVTYDEQ